MDALWETLSARRRPEDVADLICDQLAGNLSPHEAAVLERAARGALRRRVQGYTSMLEEFARPPDMRKQVATARRIFETAKALRGVKGDDPGAVEALVRALGAEIHKAFGASDFLHDRLDGAARAARGLELSRRKYNRKFRLLRHMEKRLLAYLRELKKWDLTRVGKSGLATRLAREEFLASESAACFVAYLTARANLRSEFTVLGQQRAFDEVAAMLLERCRRDPATNWWAVAHVYPQQEVLARLSDEQKGQLLGTWLDLLYQIGELLEQTWDRSRFDPHTMIVQRGDDSTTWNNLASAWNKARDGWIALVYALGLEDLLDRMCLGKVLRLMAADVVAWHRTLGGALDPNTHVWAALPYPWDVLAGRASCTRDEVRTLCKRHSVDPRTSGWIAPRPLGAPARFRPTPELVHGVAIASPHVAGVLRRAGWFSGKPETVKPLTEVLAPQDAARKAN